MSAAFLRDAAAALLARVVGAGRIRVEAIRSRRHPIRPVLVDANLPDGRGESLQAARAAMPPRASPTPRLAPTRR